MFNAFAIFPFDAAFALSSDNTEISLLMVCDGIGLGAGDFAVVVLSELIVRPH